MMKTNNFGVFVLIFLTFLMTSCATLLNKKEQSISFTMKKNVIIDSINHHKENASVEKTLFLERGKSILYLSLKYDTIKKQIEIKPKNSLAYWSNIYFNYGIGMMYEKDNPKRYAYPKRIYIDFENNDFVLRKFPPLEKGTFKFHFALPHLNFFHIKTTENIRSSFGFFGIEGGADYAYAQNKYISIYAGAVTDFFVPVPAAVDVNGPYQSTSSIYINANNNFKKGRFDFGYGMAFSKMFWKKANSIDSTFIPISTSFYTLGLSLSSMCQMGDFFHLGIMYQPSMLRFEEKMSFCYQHHATFKLIWKIPFMKKKK